MTCLFTSKTGKQTSLSRFYFFIDKVSYLSSDEHMKLYLSKSAGKQAQAAPEFGLPGRGR
tara:strand:- start:317 stop:496 length:180 start_codon:yes stop_codon:yes gene_type:complete